MLSLSAGQIVADKYRMDAVVGSGGMGVVVAATHVELGQRVAIKLLRDASTEALARFAREARLLVRLKSPHVARVFDVGSLDDDTPYIVMELLEGSDLGKVLEARGRLTTEEAADHVLEATCAVAEAHTLGMVHRDLKPANLFLAAGPGGATIVKVLDFGVSKITEERPEDATAGDLTNEGVALGSPGYMAPEQINSSRDVDARADIYSLGAILYRLVTGKNPYKGSSVVSVMASMAVDPLPPLRSLAPDAPEGFAAVVERCLAQDREARWPTVAHFARALAPFASRRGRASLEEILATMKLPSHSEPLMATIVKPLSGPVRPPLVAPAAVGAPRSESALVTLAVVVLLVGTGALVFSLVTRDVRPRTPEPPPPATSITWIEGPPPPPPSATLLGASPTSSESEPGGRPSAHPSIRRPPPPRHSATSGPAEVPPDRH